jgi:hypothetical protein
MKTRFLFIFILLSNFAWSQDSAKLNMIIDNKVDLLLKKKLELDQQKPSIQGFRVQLYYGGNRTEALELKSKFAQLHPEVESYLIYQQPYFRLRVGDFRTRLEAYKLMKKVEKEFPSVFIVNDEINFPK